jgi:hypothetical protein
VKGDAAEGGHGCGPRSSPYAVTTNAGAEENSRDGDDRIEYRDGREV